MKAFVPFEGFYNSYLGSLIDEMGDMELSRDPVARIYAQAYSRMLSVGDSGCAGIGFDAGLEFVRLQSPREYNFSTDRILCDIPVKTISAIYKKVTFATLDKVIKDRHSSRDGFVSFYSDSIGDWVNQGFLKWDDNQLEALLIAYMIDAGFSDDWQLDIAHDIIPCIY